MGSQYKLHYLWCTTLANNSGWVSVGVDHDTSAFAVETIRRWWYRMGQQSYPQATELLITADSGGSNGSRVRLWKVELQRLADETGLELRVRGMHLTPETPTYSMRGCGGLPADAGGV